MIKKITIGIVIILVAIQFFPTDKNLSDDNTYHISKSYDLPDNVNMILKNACNDCHTNSTNYPWYSNIQPIGFWLNGHITDGKRHLNFSEFTNRPLAYQNHKLEETIEMVEEKEMPLPSYTYLGLHSEANMTEEERQVLIDWAKEQMAMLKATYPADSLVMKRRGPPPPQQ
ncbi:heme-binding domain-containing protein [Algoriphagus machipongonensis]|uniref:Cytochrome c n=1 Tax=Algoriphagus machipongonensis TaxID=388413 RepID=A3HWJ6_9BACT|nr:heme-binding domain-containing protein [Algoriphagus machipongonensis]EAZ80969.1 putative Cytochrome c [Algoriphagus machipongonensis]